MQKQIFKQLYQNLKTINILIVKTSSLGDIVQSFIVIDYIKQLFPNAKIDWVVEKHFSELVKNHPKINKAIIVNTKTWKKNILLSRKEILKTFKILRTIKYDIVFDIQGNFKSALFTFFSKSKKKVGYSIKSLPEKINFLSTNKHFCIPKNLQISKQYLLLIQKYFKDENKFVEDKFLYKTTYDQMKFIDSFLKNLSNFSIFLIAPMSRWENKTINKEFLKQLLDKIQKKFNCFFIFIYGNNSEKIFIEKIRSFYKNNSKIIGNINYSILQNILSKVDLVISSDSFVLHLAATTNTPTFSVFGPTSSAVYKPEGNNHFAIQGTCPLKINFKKRCKLLRTCKNAKCIQTNLSREVFNKFVAWYAKAKNS